MPSQTPSTWGTAHLGGAGGRDVELGRPAGTFCPGCFVDQGQVAQGLEKNRMLTEWRWVLPVEMVALEADVPVGRGTLVC